MMRINNIDGEPLDYPENSHSPKEAAQEAHLEENSTIPASSDIAVDIFVQNELKRRNAQNVAAATVLLEPSLLDALAKVEGNAKLFLLSLRLAIQRVIAQ